MKPLLLSSRGSKIWEKIVIHQWDSCRCRFGHDYHEWYDWWLPNVYHWDKCEREIPKFEALTGILMQEEERRLTLKRRNADLALMAKKKFFKAKGNPSQQNGGNPQKTPNQAQGMYPNKND